MIGIGVAGAGYWGPKHIRNFSELPGSQVTMVADLSEQRLNDIQSQYRHIATTSNFEELLQSDEVDAVIVATPVSTHGQLARRALLAGKHVLVEKPLAATSREAADLVHLAAQQECVLAVGHTFLFSPAVLMLRDLVASGEIGEIYYAHSQRLNLGLFQRDINVLWDLAPHDLSILIYVLGLEPQAVAARGRAHFRPGIEDVAYMDLDFDSVSASVHVSWVDPNKVRRLTLAGTRKMVVYDDVETPEKLRVYDKGVVVADQALELGSQLSYRHGSVTIPLIPTDEPLRLQGKHFLTCIQEGTRPRADGAQGLKVVQTLEAAGDSLANGGVMVPVPTTAWEAAPRLHAVPDLQPLTLPSDDLHALEQIHLDLTARNQDQAVPVVGMTNGSAA